MYKCSLILLVLLVLVSCSSNNLPNHDEFEVKVSSIRTTANINEEIEIVTELINKSDKTFLIQHSSPLVTVQVYDERNKPLFEYLVVDDIGLSHKFKSKETYDPQEEWNPDEKRVIKIDKPGTYRLIGNASFSINQSNGARKKYSLKSEPFEIQVE